MWYADLGVSTRMLWWNNACRGGGFMNLIAACLRRSIISNVNPLGGFGRTREAWNVESWQKCVCGTMWLRRHQGPGKRKRRRLLDPRFHGQLQPGGSRGQYGSRDHSNRFIMGFDSGWFCVILSGLVGMSHFRQWMETISSSLPTKVGMHPSVVS